MTVQEERATRKLVHAARKARIELQAMYDLEVDCEPGICTDQLLAALEPFNYVPEDN